MRLVIGGVSSSSGKTTIATGLIGAFRRSGMRVQPFKAGPDYIDPSYHSLAAGVPSRNLDSWMLPSDVLRALFQRAVSNSDVAVVEGVMGFYDGHSSLAEDGSTAQLAKLLDAPVVLVVDVAGMARSAAAIVLGFQRYDPAVKIRGVILNKVGSNTHGRWVAEAITDATGLPVLGALPANSHIEFPSRHLGLVPSVEGSSIEETINKVVDEVARAVNLDALLAIGRQVPPLEPADAPVFPAQPLPKRARIGVARDEAFSFYYQDNLDLLSDWGAELVPFSPLRDTVLPPGLGALYIGGGFPEVYAQRLSENRRLREAIRDFGTAGGLIYAECGGLMYLSQGIVDFDGERHPMVGLTAAWSAMQRRHVVLGYATARARRDSFLLKAGDTLRGHEFHWSELLEPVPAAEAAYDILEQPGRVEGLSRGNLVASYVHLHFGARPDLARRFVDAARSS